MRKTTTAELEAALRETLNLAKPAAMTAGEYTTTLQNAGFTATRNSVKKLLDAMVEAGEVAVEYRSVVRNGHTVPNARHYYSRRAMDEYLASLDPFERFDDVAT